MGNSHTFLSNEDRFGRAFRASFSGRFQKGYTTNVHKARLFTPGLMEPEKAIVKTFKNQPGTKELCKSEIKKVQKATEIMDAFNSRFVAQNFPVMKLTEILMTNLYHAHFNVNGRRLSENEWVIIDKTPLRQFTYFTDQYGKSIEDVRRFKCLQSLEHFSYDYTNGEMVMTDLKGSRTSNDEFTFTMPTIHSVNKNYGPKDEGMEGIEKVFESHNCNDACEGLLKLDSQTEMKSRPRTASAPDESEMYNHNLPERFTEMSCTPPPYTPYPDLKFNFNLVNKTMSEFSGIPFEWFDMCNQNLCLHAVNQNRAENVCNSLLTENTHMVGFYND